ncbi:putative methyltransferase-domain-containing protein [Geopyxis carbonaria]|nr:putative methyltransferase-domain-containing protein [Geopyxis carbonaria]
MPPSRSPSPTPSNTSDASDFGLNLPSEPADYFPPTPPPSTLSHTLTTSPFETLSLSLVGHNPLWGHKLWLAGLLLSRHLETHADTLVHGASVLELGAGAGLPGLTCALRGAQRVVISDYPDTDLIQNIARNIDALPSAPTAAPVRARAVGYCWGADAAPLLEDGGRFDVVLLSDLVFNHSEHGKLADTVVKCLKKERQAVALVFFTPHRPWLYEKDLAFFKTAEEAGFTVEKVVEERVEKPMFEEDPGDRDLRRTVFGYELRWKEEMLQGA